MQAYFVCQFTNSELCRLTFSVTLIGLPAVFSAHGYMASEMHNSSHIQLTNVADARL